jgi:hypothetical protein
MIFLALLSIFTVQAQQSIGKWTTFSNSNGVLGISTLSINGTSGRLYIECEGNDVKMYTRVPGILSNLTGFLKIDTSESEIYTFALGSKGEMGIFQSDDVLKLIRLFLTARYFSLVIEKTDRWIAVVFDLTGFGQATKFAPCLQKALNR